MAYVKYVRITHTEYKAYSKNGDHFTIPFLVTLDMVMSFPVYISSFYKVTFYFKTEIEANVRGS